LRYRFTSRWQRVFSASVFGCFFFLETGAYFDKNGTQPGEIAFTSALLAVIAWLAVRAARAATLLANDDKITVRSFLRTRSWSWDEIGGFVVDTRLVGSRYMQYRRRMLGMRGHDGTVAGNRQEWRINNGPGTTLRESKDPSLVTYAQLVGWYRLGCRTLLQYRSSPGCSSSPPIVPGYLSERFAQGWP
jgi:hypothetical protein